MSGSAGGSVEGSDRAPGVALGGVVAGEGAGLISRDKLPESLAYTLDYIVGQVRA